MLQEYRFRVFTFSYFTVNHSRRHEWNAAWFMTRSLKKNILVGSEPGEVTDHAVCIKPVQFPFLESVWYTTFYNKNQSFQLISKTILAVSYHQHYLYYRNT